MRVTVENFFRIREVLLFQTNQWFVALHSLLKFFYECNASITWSPQVNTGFNDVIGSWKIMAILLPRICLHIVFFAATDHWSCFTIF